MLYFSILKSFSCYLIFNLRIRLQPLLGDQRQHALRERFKHGSLCGSEGAFFDDEDIALITALGEKITKGTLVRWEKEKIDLQNNINSFLEGFM